MNSGKKRYIRIAHYNIFHGGKLGLNKVFKVIQKINPDLCGILELVGSDAEIEIFKKTSKKHGYNLHIAKANSKYNIGLMSKVPVDIEIIKKNIRHVVLMAKLKIKNIPNITIFFVHLSPVSEEERMKEIQKILNKASKYNNKIIMGDFNSLSKNDNYNEKKLLEIFNELKIKKYGENRLKFNVIEKIKDSNLFDIIEQNKKPFMHTTPTPANKDPNHAAPLRIDYIFVSKDLLPKIKKTEVCKTKDADKASDHYPMYIDFKK